MIQYNGLAGNLTNTKAQAEGFYNKLNATRSFNWGDALAWDRDFEESGVGSPAEGTDTTWADDVDMVFFSGHGSPDRFYFGIAKDDALARSTEIRWGNKQLEWIALDACNVLEREGVFDGWRAAFQRLHYMLGFHTTTSDEAHRGRILAEHLNAGDTVRTAWIKACQETEDSSVQWAYMRADDADSDTYNDHWHGEGFVSSDPKPPVTLYYARGTC